ncbi:hypothetical protein JK358_38455 [Nocardia sp. 2]|uniref:Uncharacterized protein n=1 Tax=Nocardia acididurans TaxID=2802282 RepID=A0ABS1MI80_9NOCA|nr:hypothetical protein [Nocardia acididurans]MBL1080294.1 hypothetical protein [Nocardia acididurans]
MQHLHEEEQIVAENLVLAEAAAQALLAARRAVHRWAHDREQAAGHTTGHSANTSAAQQHSPRQRSPRQSLWSRMFGRRQPAPQVDPSPANQLEKLVAEWAAHEAQREYAWKVARSWEESSAELGKRLKAAGADPSTARGIADRHVDIDVERVTRLASEYTLAELNAARALVEQQTQANGRGTEHSEPKAAQTAAAKDSDKIPEQWPGQPDAAKAAPPTAEAKPKAKTAEAGSADTTARKPRARKSAPVKASDTAKASDAAAAGAKLAADTKPAGRKRAAEKQQQLEAEAPQQLPPEQAPQAAPEAAVAP